MRPSLRVVGDSSVEVEAAAVLRRIGARVTRPRLAVLECVLSAETSHLSADEILERVTAQEPTVHRATVYRTLDGLARAGVLTHVHLDRGLTAYHLSDAARVSDDADASAAPPHLHAQCSVCGRVLDLPATVLGATAQRVRETVGFELDAGHVALSGRCATCVQAESHH